MAMAMALALALANANVSAHRALNRKACRKSFLSQNKDQTLCLTLGLRYSLFRDKYKLCYSNHVNIYIVELHLYDFVINILIKPD